MSSFKIAVEPDSTAHTTHYLESKNFPSWSPDGRRVVFASARNGNVEIVVINADGSGEKVITNDPGFDYFPG